MSDKHHGETAEYWWNRYVQAVAERDALQASVDVLEGKRLASLQEYAMNAANNALIAYNRGGNPFFDRALNPATGFQGNWLF